MKTLLTAGITFAALSAASAIAPAMAADMAPRPAPAPMYKAPPPVAVFSWTGCYLGASGGYAWGRSTTTTTIIDPVPNFTNFPLQTVYNANMSPTVNPKGGVAGGQIGCNYQSGSFVFGGETDFSYFRLTDGVVTSVVPAGSPLTTTTGVSTNWLWTARLRAGFAVDRALFYVTGGAAIAKVNYEQFNAFNPCGGPGGACLELGATSTTRTGWTAGAGVEYAVTNNWTVKAEYLYMDFGSLSTTGTVSTNVPAANVPFNHNANLKVSTVRVGVNYLFGGPVVARY